jgi:hypothetical protein
MRSAIKIGGGSLSARTGIVTDQNGQPAPNNWSTKMDLKQVRELFDYDPSTGYLRWKLSLNPRIKVGSIAGKGTPKGYVYVGIGGKHYAAHCLIWLLVTGRWPKDQMDHINHIRNDNRLSNLREATNSENQLSRWRRWRRAQWV